MDKAEYRTKMEEINSLAEAGKFREAAEIADQIEWKHVKSARTLCMIGEIYEADKRYEDSARILRYAYKRSSSSKTVLYRLAELDIRNGDYDEAKRFINEFEQNSPNDTSRYILKYKILRAEKAPLDDQIEVLREYKDHEYTERWAYELAKLYKKNGQKDRCIEECDDLILWFTEGKYVTKAMELKMSLTTLTPAQQAAYDNRYRAEEKQEEAPADETETVQLTGMEQVEKQILRDDDDDEDAKPKVSADEAISKMDLAAESLRPAFEEPSAAEEAPEKASVGSKVSGFQKKLTKSIRAVFSGIRHTDEDEDEDMKIVPDKSERDLMPVVPEDEVAVESVDTAENGAEAAEQPRPAETADASDESLDADLSEAFKAAREAADRANGAAEEMAGEAAEAAEDLAGTAAEHAAGEAEAASASPSQAASASEAAESAAAETAESAAKEAAEAAVVTGNEAAETVENAAAEAVDAAADGSAPADVPEDPSREQIPDEEIDLEKLFAETSTAFADEVASGSYVLADTLEDDRERAEADAEKMRRISAGELPEEAEENTHAADNLLGRETDESLGLTRELHLRDAIEKELERRNAENSESESSTPIMRPEEAARMAVAEAHGVPYELGRDEDLSRETLHELPEGVSDEDMIRMYESDEAVRKELLVSSDDQTEIPEEESREVLMDLSDYSDKESAEGRSIIDSIMGEPDVFTTIPVEGRQLTEPEKKAMSYFASIPGVDYQVTSALADVHNNCGDKTSRSGNIAIMGRQGSGKTRLAEGLILMICMHLNIKAAKVGRIVSEQFNKKDPAQVVGQMAGGFLIIEAAGGLSDEAIDKLNQAMEFRTDDLVVILEDEKADMKVLLDKHPAFAEKFTSRITVPVFTNDELVTFARAYAKEEGYKFDEMATLALYTMIGDNQRDTEPMTVGKVRELVDKAIERNSRKLFGKTTDKEDGRIVLMEKDFNF